MIELERVSDSVWAHTKGKTRGNGAFIKLKDNLVMVDTGMDPVTTKNLREQAEKETGLPFKYVILTHYHTDHVFGNQVFEDCEILSTKATYNIMKKNKEVQWTEENLKERMKETPELKKKWKDLRIVLPTKTFEERYTIEEAGKKVRIVEANGHTEGDVYVYLPDEDILIVGDLLFAKTYPYGGDPTADPYLWIQALDEMIKSHPKKVVPGHGPITKTEELKLHRNYLNDLVEEMKRFVKLGRRKAELEAYDNWPDFPYEVDTDRHQSMLEHTYEFVKKNT
ncbi:MAG: MBL fold metallo-hydrolase [Candidatus Korarchaeota archaeon]|nr:MBL fold metallo-hydrolase [Candidatus Korarchaeota archaeon]NIU83107.1 MBL fold metallo-hydrolase [Candidatus Thorarchaeota archaeon]NIW13485.1 MBL fold metallo-hydrolase [Candidatus Thorarchaeota archaeon]